MQALFLWDNNGERDTDLARPLLERAPDDERCGRPPWKWRPAHGSSVPRSMRRSSGSPRSGRRAASRASIAT